MQKLKELRIERGIQQKDLAATLGIGANTLSQYENGKREPDNKTLVKLADYFGVSVDYLLEHTDAPEKQENPSWDSESKSKAHYIDDDDVKVALFGGDGEVTDEMWDEVRNFVDYVKSKHSKGGK